MEQSLQSINAAITIPYWDYTQVTTFTKFGLGEGRFLNLCYHLDKCRKPYASPHEYCMHDLRR